MAQKQRNRISLSLTDELREALAQLSQERGQAIAYIIREATAAYLGRSKIHVNHVHPKWGGGRWVKDGDK